MAGSEITIRAIAYKNGYTSSQVVTSTYTIADSGGPRSYSWTVVASARLDEICALDSRSQFTIYTDVDTLQSGITLYLDDTLETSANTETFYLDISAPGNTIWYYDINGTENTRQICGK